MCMQLTRIVAQKGCRDKASDECCGVYSAMVGAKCHCWPSLDAGAKEAIENLAGQCSPGITSEVGDRICKCAEQ